MKRFAITLAFLATLGTGLCLGQTTTGYGGSGNPPPSFVHNIKHVVRFGSIVAVITPKQATYVYDPLGLVPFDPKMAATGMWVGHVRVLGYAPSVTGAISPR